MTPPGRATSSGVALALLTHIRVLEEYARDCELLAHQLATGATAAEFYREATIARATTLALHTEAGQ